ncbi:unnamed protein product [Staurois parvus]|uniref:Uncharacterized protein n=1 Tax=Staurois parvus TaxID=386267 RepID=A0ABN9DCW7_9NEOB|nr:unnamed protein product [Staurois parvus]
MAPGRKGLTSGAIKGLTVRGVFYQGAGGCSSLLHTVLEGCAQQSGTVY